MRAEHSSEFTLLYKALLPVAYVLVWGMVVVQAFRAPGAMTWNGVEGAAPVGIGWVVVAVGAVGFAQVLWLAEGLARVRTAGRHLLLSGFSTEVSVPAEQVEHVTLWWWSRPGLVTIVLREPTPFGRRVSFVPPLSALRLLGFGWVDDAPVRELRRWARESAPVDLDR